MQSFSKEQLRQAISDADAPDNTEYIRELKNSERILQDVRTIEKLRREHTDMSADEFTELCQKEASFLFNAFTVIFNKLVANELNLALLAKIIHILQNIENGHVDQYTASVKVGELLKEIYIDSAERRGEKIDAEHEASKPAPVVPQNISWREFKNTMK